MYRSMITLINNINRQKLGRTYLWGALSADWCLYTKSSSRQASKTALAEASQTRSRLSQLSELIDKNTYNGAKKFLDTISQFTVNMKHKNRHLRRPTKLRASPITRFKDSYRFNPYREGVTPIIITTQHKRYNIQSKKQQTAPKHFQRVSLFSTAPTGPGDESQPID